MKDQLSTSGTSFPVRLYHPARQAVMNAVGIGFMAVFLLLPCLSVAGNLDSPAATTSTGSAMFTITDIYNRLNTGAVATKRGGGFTEPIAGPAPTGKTLDDVMTLVNSRAHAVCAGTLNGTRWCDNGDGTVTDLTTGLIWLKDASWAGAVSFWLNTSSGINAHDKASSLSAAGNAALSDGSVEGDWRLPTLKELKHLTNSGAEDVLTTTPGAFINIVAGGYMSSTSKSAQPIAVWVVALDIAGVVGIVNKAGPVSVWPVRGQ